MGLARCHAAPSVTQDIVAVKDAEMAKTIPVPGAKVVVDSPTEVSPQIGDEEQRS